MPLSAMKAEGVTSHDAVPFALSRGSREVEEELRMLASYVPHSAREIPQIFKSAVQDALSNLLDESTSMALQVYIGYPNLTNPDAVFSSLDTLLMQGSATLKEAITEEFGVRVHSRFESELSRIQSIIVGSGQALTQVLGSEPKTSTGGTLAPATRDDRADDPVTSFVRSAATSNHGKGDGARVTQPTA